MDYRFQNGIQCGQNIDFENLHGRNEMKKNLVYGRHRICYDDCMLSYKQYLNTTLRLYDLITIIYVHLYHKM